MWTERGHWAVQQTKLIPPTKNGILVERGRLLARALDASRGRLLLITAAAGYGKTSVLAQVHEQLARQQLHVGWLSLDEADNDHARFLSHLVESLRNSGLGSGLRFGSAISTLLGSGAPPPASILRTSLLNELAAIDQDLFVFLDDYHLIVDAEVRETLAAMLLAPLPRIHLLVATRSRNELPVNRLLALGQMTEIDGADLAFSDHETGEFIGSSCSKHLDLSQLARLRAQTEGWAASLQLAAIALNGVEDIARFLDEFSGETRAVGEFLGEEVLRRQPESLQQFLMETAVLKRFNTGLAQVVTGREDSRSVLDELESRNLFIFSLDDQRNWYRYHHLFADFLQRRLRDRQPGRCETLHRRAADWLTTHGFLTDAIDHAFLAADAKHAGALLDAACVQLFAAGQLGTLHKQAARLPRELLLRLPRLQLELTWDYELQWQFSAARGALSKVREILESADATLNADEKAFLSSKLAHRELMLALLTDRLPEAHALARQWTEKTPAEDPFMRASVGTTQMHADRERYLCEGTPMLAESLHRQFLEVGAHYGTVFHDSVSGITLFMRGDLEAAEQTYERARRTAIALQGEDSRLTAMPTTLLAELCYERGDLARARDLLARHGRSTVAFGFADHPIARFVTCSRLAFTEGRAAEAEEALEAGLHLAEKHELPRLRAHFLNERVRQQIASGHGQQAAAILEQPRYRSSFESPAPGDEPTTTQELLALAWSRICIDRGEHSRALPVLRRWLAHIRERRCARATVRISAVLAHLHASSGDTTAARRVLREALLLTPRGGFVRSFVDEGPTVVALLRDLQTSLPDADSELARRLHEILLAVDPVAQSAMAAGSLGLPGGDQTDKLSERELEIIKLTAQGMATSDLSAALGLTDATVKWYWQRIFSKLQVHRRFEAVKLARRRGWMS
ncbi:MAG: LuxR C-terminal-related transcriptional regulator [Panacagrimonas sp.]